MSAAPISSVASPVGALFLRLMLMIVVPLVFRSRFFGVLAVATISFWPYWPMVFRTSSSQEEGAIRDFASLTGKQPALVKTFHPITCDFSAGGWCGRACAPPGAQGTQGDEETRAMTITEFLLARIADDEAAADIAEAGDWKPTGLHAARQSPARVLAQCEAMLFL